MNKLFLLSLVLFGSCTSSSFKENVNKVGDAAGQTAGEFIEGASKGVEKAFDVKVNLSPELISKGIGLGKTTVADDTIGTDNLLVLYVIFNKDFESDMTAKVYDENALEMGRTKVHVTGKADETQFVEFHFDRHTNIDSKNILLVE